MTLFSVCGFDLHIRLNPVEPKYITKKTYGAKPATSPHPASLKENVIYKISNTYPNKSRRIYPGKACYGSSTCCPNTPTASVSSTTTSPSEVELRLACQLPESLQTPHNKLLALLLESLNTAPPKWLHKAGARGPLEAGQAAYSQGIYRQQADSHKGRKNYVLNPECHN